MLKVADIMTDELFAVPASAAVRDAAWSMAEHGAHAALVQDQRGHVVGTITTDDLADMKRRPRRRGAPAVSEVMSSRVVVVHADDPAANAVKLLADEQIAQLVVLDADDQVVGIVTAMDVLRAMVSGTDSARL